MTGALADDLLDPDVVRDPYPYLARLREQSPVHFSAAHQGWLVTRYDDVVAGLKDEVRLSSDRIGPLLARVRPERRTEFETVMGLLQEFMIVKDPPEHTRLRALVTRAFRPQRVAAMEQRIAELADEMLDEFAVSGDTDFAQGFAQRFPAGVIAELIGAPAADRARLQAWSDDLGLVAFGAGTGTGSDRHARALAGLQQMLDYFDGLIARARSDPGQDMISGLLEGDGHGDALSVTEMKTMCALMFFGGHETSASLASSGLWMLSRFPDQLALLREDPEGRAGGAVEELLRLEPPIKLIIRRATTDFDLGGTRIGTDDRVHLIVSAANRDPARFPAPDVIDITRTPNPHVSFAKGVHTCLGAQLARIEARVVLSRVFDRLPALRVPDQPIEWRISSGSRSLVSLHVEHTRLAR